MGLDLDYLAGKEAIDKLEEKLSSIEHGERGQFSDKIIKVIDLLLDDSIVESIDWKPLVNRVEVIDDNGRSYVKREIKSNVGISFQDNNETIKIFI